MSCIILYYIAATAIVPESLLDFRIFTVKELETPQKISIDRMGDGDDVVSLLRIYKDRSFSLCKKPMVCFANEPAEYVWAVTREYFDWAWRLY